MEDNFEKLNLLLEQEQCEFVDIPDGFTGQTESGELRLIYLMNDAVESFLVLKNARMTGNYVRDYEGEFEGSVEKADRDLCEAEYILVVHQGRNVFTVFFEDILLETHLYNYGELGHFWVKGYENLRVMEYQIAILRDKYEYLGEKYCTEYERKLAMLRDFPPLNYLFYPAVPEKYIVPVDNPWEVTAEALAVMQELATEADSVLNIEDIEYALECMEQAIRQKIRKVDVCTRYSSMQYLIILFEPIELQIPRIMERIFIQYYKYSDSHDFKPGYEYLTMSEGGKDSEVKN